MKDDMTDDELAVVLAQKRNTRQILGEIDKSRFPTHVLDKMETVLSSLVTVLNAQGTKLEQLSIKAPIVNITTDQREAIEATLALISELRKPSAPKVKEEWKHIPYRDTNGLIEYIVSIQVK